MLAFTSISPYLCIKCPSSIRRRTRKKGQKTPKKGRKKRRHTQPERSTKSHRKMEERATKGETSETDKHTYLYI